MPNELRPQPRPIPDEATEEWEALVTRRHQRVEALRAEQNRLEQTRVSAVRTDLQQHSVWLQKRIQDNEADRDKKVKSSPLWRAEEALLRSVPGMGPVVSRTLLALLAELGTLDRKQIAALVGLAPYHQDSGKSQGKRAIRGGRSRVRAALYMATLVAVGHNPVLARIYTDLRARGKLAKVALTACMRRLLVLLNAMMRDRLPWSQTRAVLPLQATEKTS